MLAERRPLDLPVRTYTKWMVALGVAAFTGGAIANLVYAKAHPKTELPTSSRTPDFVPTRPVVNPSITVPEDETKLGPLVDATQERVRFTAGEIATAEPEGLPGRLRIGGDDVGAFRTLLDGASAAKEPWLVLSGGLDNGAYSAGLLNGWTQAGNRPRFGVITGASSGAFIAPFAFIGSAGDEILKKYYTEITAADVFELGGSPIAAITDNWPLKEVIKNSITPILLKAIAVEHAKGRRLLITTTQLDTERLALWDMGAIASLASDPETNRYGDKALKLFRDVVLASTALPVMFPPVMIGSRAADGKVFQELHADGSMLAPFYIGPAPALFEQDQLDYKLPTHTIFLVINNRMSPEFGIVSPTLLGMLGNSMSAALKAQSRGALVLAQSFALRSGLDLRVNTIDGRFTKAPARPFDPDYMKALFEYGENLGRVGSPAVSNQAPERSAGPTFRSAASVFVTIK